MVAHPHHLDQAMVDHPFHHCHQVKGVMMMLPSCLLVMSDHLALMTMVVGYQYLKEVVEVGTDQTTKGKTEE